MTCKVVRIGAFFAGMGNKVIINDKTKYRHCGEI